MKLDDPYESPAAQSWRIIDGSTITEDRRFEADVVIIGSGAGGGIAAEIFSRAGRRVLLVEEGALRTSRHFDLDEGTAYRQLYQEGVTRLTDDGSIAIMQGRTVGGSTTVNWTSSFRTPSQTTAHWQAHYGFQEIRDETLRPWFDILEKRLSISPWLAPNLNNDAIRRGSERLSWSWKPIPRNVKGCWNLGYCGFGCPTNAKQSMLVTSIPAALTHGTTLLHQVRAQQLHATNGRITGLSAVVADRPSIKINIQASLFLLAGGAIGSPALLLRSEQIPDPYQRVGRRTFLHPSVFTFGQMEKEVAPYHGAPQSIYCDEFQWANVATGVNGTEGPMGYKIEATPMPPIFSSVLMRGFGTAHREKLQKLSTSAGLLALLRDGFHPDSPGGTVTLRSDDTPVLSYPFTDYLTDGVRRAFLSMTEMLFAAGAKAVHVGHNDSELYPTWSAAKQAINNLDFRPLMFRLGSAHVMGGCAMGPDPRSAVVNEKGQHHHVENLYICDGSQFPTSIGANPQLSIFASSARIAHNIIGDDEIYFDAQYLPK